MSALYSRTGDVSSLGTADGLSVPVAGVFPLLVATHVGKEANLKFLVQRIKKNSDDPLNPK